MLLFQAHVAFRYIYFVLLVGGWGLNLGPPAHSQSTLPTELLVNTLTPSHALSALCHSGTSKGGCRSHLADQSTETSKSQGLDVWWFPNSLVKQELLFGLIGRIGIFIPSFPLCSKKLHMLFHISEKFHSGIKGAVKGVWGETGLWQEE